MDIDGAQPKYDKKTLKDQHGQYPMWMNQRAIRKHKAKVKGSKVTKHTTGKKGKKKTLW